MKLTPEKLTAFCAALAETGVVSKACKAVDIARVTAYEWRDEIPEFAAAWDKALRIGITALEDEAHRRAFDGTEEPVFHHGNEVGAVRKYSDTLAIFLLKAHAPEKYRERTSVEMSGSLEINKLSDDELDQEIAALTMAKAPASTKTPIESIDNAGDCDDLV